VENRKAGMSFWFGQEGAIIAALSGAFQRSWLKTFSSSSVFSSGFNPAAFGITLFRWLSSSISGP
jgi:hypothetical protein